MRVVTLLSKLNSIHVFPALGNVKDIDEGHGNGNINHTGNKCDPCSPPFVANRDSPMSFLNSFWFTLTAFFLQKSSINPKVLYVFIILLVKISSSLTRRSL